MKKACATRPAESPVLEHLDPFLPEKGQSVAIVGVSQNGKTTEAWKWADAFKQGSVRTVAWDSAFQWAKDGLKRDDAELGPLSRTVTVEELEQNPELLLERRLSLAVRPADIFADREVIAEEFCRFGHLLVRSMAGGRLALFVDECNIMADNARAQRLLTDMAERWGKEGIVPFFITQRWTHLNTDVRAEVAWILSFHQNKRSDLRQLTTDAGRDFSAAVETLEPYQYRARFLRRALSEALVGPE